jgi:hypothetical protein
VIFFANVNANKANLSQQMDYKVRSHDLGNLPCSCYYVKKVLQFLRLVINIRVKERVYSVFKNKVHIILMQQDAWYKTWYMCSIFVRHLDAAKQLYCRLLTTQSRNNAQYHYKNKKHSPMLPYMRLHGT